MYAAKYSIIALMILALAGCSGVRSNAVIPVQSKDKQLTCREILLEMNEAEQYKIAAENNKNPDVRSFLAPFGYAYTITSANEAIESAEKRINYLREVYQISGCTSGASGLSEQQLRGHTFMGGFPTPSPAQQRAPF
jgi:hypothetical protein